MSFPAHRPSEVLGYTAEERAAATAEGIALVRAALRQPEPEARAAALAGACFHPSPLVGFSAVACLIERAAR